jgi:hypothetical protein
VNTDKQDYEIPDEKLSYSELKDRIREEVAGALPKKERIMLLAKKLEDDLAIKDTICSQICTDFKDLISLDYIRKCLPKEYKQKSKMRRGACNTNIAKEGKNVSEQIVQISSTGEETYEPVPEPKPTQEVKRLRAQLADMADILKKKDEEIDFLRSTQPIQDIPQLVDNRIGPVKVQNLAKVSKFHRRGLQILASRIGEVIRRKLVAEGKVGVKFYMLAKDRTTGIESIVPVMFTMDMHNRSTELKLDEADYEKST